MNLPWNSWKTEYVVVHPLHSLVLFFPNPIDVWKEREKKNICWDIMIMKVQKRNKNTPCKSCLQLFPSLLCAWYCHCLWSQNIIDFWWVKIDSLNPTACWIKCMYFSRYLFLFHQKKSHCYAHFISSIVTKNQIQFLVNCSFRFWPTLMKWIGNKCKSWKLLGKNKPIHISICYFLFNLYFLLPLEL